MAGRCDKVTTFKIFVKNLAPGTTQEELKSVFETFGRVVECNIFKDTLAFIHMENEISGRNAILMLNSKLINGKCVVVEESKQKDGPSISSTRLRIRNVPNTLSANELKNLFTKYGAILCVEITDDIGIVTIEAIADIRSAINEMNGYAWEGHQIIVEPIVNTAISYCPKKTRPPAPTSPWYDAYPQKYSGPPKRTGKPAWSRGPRPMNVQWNSRMQHTNVHNPESRVLRDPYGSFGPPSCIPTPTQHQFSSPVREQDMSNVSIEPLFFKRHEFVKGQTNQTNEASFNEDVQFKNFGDNHMLFDPLFNPPPPRSELMFGYQQRVPIKRQHAFEDGEAFHVPGMIAPGTFRPPKKYFSHLPSRPKKKKKNTGIRPQLPIPEEIQRPVPDFSSYYTVPNGSSLKPFPPPKNPDYDFSEDVGV